MAVCGISRICSVDQRKIALIRCQGLGIPPVVLWCVPLLPSVSDMLPSCQAAQVRTRRESSWRAWLSLGSSFCLGGCLYPFRARAAAAAVATAASACVTRTGWLRLLERLADWTWHCTVVRIRALSKYRGLRTALLCCAWQVVRPGTSPRLGLMLGGGSGGCLRMVCGCISLRQYGNNDYCSLKIEKQFADKLLVPSTARLLPTRHGCRNRNSEVSRALLH